MEGTTGQMFSLYTACGRRRDVPPRRRNIDMNRGYGAQWIEAVPQCRVYGGHGAGGDRRGRTVGWVGGTDPV